MPPQLMPGSSAMPADAARRGLPRVLWRRKWLVVAPVVVILVLALVYLQLATRRYTSRARFTVTQAGSRLAGDSADYGQSANFLYTQREKLLSRDILAGVLAMPAGNVPGARSIKDLKTFTDSEAPLEDLRDGLEIDVGRKDDTVSISYETPYPEEAPVIVNAVIDNYIRWQTRPHKRSNTAEVMDAYVAERAKVEQELAAKTAAMADLERQYGILNSKDNQNVAFGQLSSISQTLEAQRSQALRDKQDYEAAARAVRPEARRLAAMGGMNGVGGGGDVLVSAEDEQMLRTQIIQLQQQISEMRQRYLPNHPAVVAAQQRLEAMGVAYADALQRRYLRSKAIQDDLQKQFDDQSKRAVEVSAKMAQYARLESDADRMRRLIDTLETRIHGVDLQSAAGQVDIDFFEPASTARQSHPAPKRTLAMALMLGLMLGVGMALLRDWMDDRLRSADEIRSAVGVPLLGLIPQMPAGASQSVSAQKVVLDPTSDVAEAYRSLRTAIYFGAPRDRSKTILITSPSPGDGKTTSSANLAAVMAQAGKRVLLIDADLRNPKLHAIFGVRDGWKGLSAVLCEQVDLEGAIHKTAIANLDLMPCGARPHNPSELLNSPAFSEMLETLADKYDQVIIDSPPVMGLADTRIIAACCDVTLLVLRAEKSTRRMSLIARDGLGAVGAQVLGVIVNDVSRRSEGDFDSAATAYGYGDRPPVQSRRHVQEQGEPATLATQGAPAPAAGKPATNQRASAAAGRGLLDEQEDDIQLFHDA